MKRFLSVLLLLGTNAVCAADVIPRSPDVPLSTASAHGAGVVNGATVPIRLSDVANSAFCVGEQLTFVIKYEFVNAGTATMSVKQGPLIDGRPSMHIETVASSNGFVDAFFKVRDFNASTVDSASLNSRNFHQNLKEGGYKVIRNTSIDYNKRAYTFQRTKNNHTTERTGVIQQPVYDILSAFFYTRTLDLKPGKTEEMTVFSDEDIYQMVIKVDPKVETITVPAGKFRCLKIEPGLKGDSIFQSNGSKMFIWLTNDEKKMPVLIRSKVFIGAFDAELASYQPENLVFDSKEGK